LPVNQAPGTDGNQGKSQRALGSRPFVVWLIKHLVSPLDRFVVRVSGGRWRPPSRFFVPTLLLTTVGRRSGVERTVPLVYVRDGERFVVANARPAGERRNPWVLNLRAAGAGRIRVGRLEMPVVARELGGDALERWWPDLVAAWPAFGDHYAATGERAVFVLEPVVSHTDDP
jgi:deazaflavin-dependent oxidoreductase (nitroreductase family)